MWLTLPLAAQAAAPITLPPYDPSKSLAPLVEAVAPAVVTLEVESDARLPQLPPEILQRLPFDPGLLPQTQTGQGSGFFVSEEGLLLTNWHVVDGATQVVAVTADGRRLPAGVVGGDRSLDVALLEVDSHEPWLALGDSDGLRVGDWVLAMGNGLGLGSTATVGIVSGRGRSVGHAPLASEFLQTDAAINEGNSGGPVFSLDGRVVGMSTATVMGANTVGFAIPSGRLLEILDDLRTHGRVARGYLGVMPQDGTEDARGAVLAQVGDDTPASRAGLEVGDRITSVDGDPIDDATDLVRTIAALHPGRTVTLAVDRGARSLELEAELGTRPEEPGLAPATPDREVAGLMLEGAASDAGVLVLGVDGRSPLHGKVRRGDRILEVNHRPVESADTLARVLERSDGEVTLSVDRAGIRTLVVARLGD